MLLPIILADARLRMFCIESILYMIKSLIARLIIVRMFYVIAQTLTAQCLSNIV